MKKLKSFKTLSSLAAIAATTPIVVSACSDKTPEPEPITEKTDISALPWTATGNYTVPMIDQQIKDEFVKNNPAGQNGIPQDIYHHIFVTVDKRSEADWYINLNTNDSSKIYCGNTSAIITAKINITNYVWHFNGNYDVNMSKQDIIKEFKTNNKTLIQGGALPNDIYDYGNVEVVPTYSGPNWSITLTTQSDIKYIGEIKNNIILYGAMTYNNKQFLLQSEGFDFGDLCGKNIWKVQTISGELDIDDRSKLIDLCLPDTVAKSYIEDYFLYGCANLCNVNLNQSLSSSLVIGNNFLANGSSLISLSLGSLKNIKRIEKNFLSNCSNLTTLDLSTLTNVEQVYTGFLANCTSLQTIKLPEYNADSSLAQALNSSVASQTWWKTTNKGLFIVPAGQKDNWAEAFNYTEADIKIHLLEVDQAQSYISYDGGFFALDDTLDPNFFTGKTSTLKWVVPLKDGQELVIDDHSKVTSLCIANFSDVNSIDDNFLAGCTNLKTLFLPKTSNIKTIKNNFLSSCAALKSVDLSCFSQVELIGTNFINSCSKLTYLDLNPLSNINKIPSDFITDSTNLVTLDLNELTNVYNIENNFLLNSGIKSIDLSPFYKVQTIQEAFMRGCNRLTEVDTSPLWRATTIENRFLEDCAALEKVNLSGFSNVKTIGQLFLTNCPMLTDINLDSLTNVSIIGSYFLNHDDSLLSIDMSNMTSLEVIEQDFLTYCPKLEILTVPFIDPSDDNLIVDSTEFLVETTNLRAIYAGDYAEQYKNTSPWNTKASIIKPGRG